MGGGLLPDEEENCVQRGSRLCRAASAGRQAALQWRPMSEAPRDETLILIACDSGDVVRAYWYAATWFVYFPDAWISESDCVAWLPLPEAPKEVT
jgi:hypothetical protein